MENSQIGGYLLFYLKEGSLTKKVIPVHLRDQALAFFDSVKESKDLPSVEDYNKFAQIHSLTLDV